LPEVLEGKRKRLSHQSNSRKKITNMEHGITKLEQITSPLTLYPSPFTYKSLYIKRDGNYRVKKDL
jgi:hypothetical protein